MRNDKHLLVPVGKKISLKDYDPGYTAGFESQEDTQPLLNDDIQRTAELQDILFANASYSLLIILQAMDAAGKDGTIKHVMTGVNPQGCKVYNFKQPTSNELAHDYLWRHVVTLPPRGQIGIFNRSYYEEVITTRVHPEYVLGQHIPAVRSLDDINEKFWERRYEEINNFERYLTRQGVVILKFFLHVSKKEQKKRFLERIEDLEKNWKFSHKDIEERQLWNEYQDAYAKALSATSTKHAPWYIIPADNKWFTRCAVSDIIANTLEDLKLKYPTIDKKERSGLLKAKKKLQEE